MSNASSVVIVDLLALAKDANYFNTLAATSGSSPAISLLSFDPAFENSVLGPTARARKLADLVWEAFHEGGSTIKRQIRFAFLQTISLWQTI